MCGRKIETRKTEYDEKNNVCIRTRYCKHCKQYIKTYEYCDDEVHIHFPDRIMTRQDDERILARINYRKES